MTPSLNELDYRQGKLLFIIWGIIALLLITYYRLLARPSWATDF